MELALTGTLSVAKAHRLRLDGRLKGGHKLVHTGYNVVVTVKLIDERVILLAGPYDTEAEAETAKARYTINLAHLKA